MSIIRYRKMMFTKQWREYLIYTFKEKFFILVPTNFFINIPLLASPSQIKASEIWEVSNFEIQIRHSSFLSSFPLATKFIFTTHWVEFVIYNNYKIWLTFG